MQIQKYNSTQLKHTINLNIPKDRKKISIMILQLLLLIIIIIFQYDQYALKLINFKFDLAY